MAALKSIVKIPHSIQNITKLITKVSLSTNSLIHKSPVNIFHKSCLKQSTAGFHTTTKRHDLMEFFDEEKNWGQDRIRVGRSWNKDELRLKSNQDLHKLWYVLLKEKNMLMTMEHECNRAYEYFPNPERIDKVEDSMANLEQVVRERNIAFHELETGEHGERPSRYVNSQLGLKFRYKLTEHVIPYFMNSQWKKSHIFRYGGNAVSKFRSLYREKLFIEKKREISHQNNLVKVILKRFPNVDKEALKAAYPKANVEKLLSHPRSRGHYVP
ncbi:39S ribosomal protein L47, mitochondrial [Microplitis demolitor]|uniref:39S ribosomal protein L47, mitochondrial n=1 Tax=Microplitis demolitor TaxID=69319 RepID=UPI0004CDAE61|nr:39S ribosomal protein L47, mitochondrial [Microplitis demolitor]